jgi:hypothetical protein
MIGEDLCGFWFWFLGWCCFPFLILACLFFSMHCDGVDVLIAPIPIDGFRAARVVILGVLFGFEV